MPKFSYANPEDMKVNAPGSGNSKPKFSYAPEEQRRKESLGTSAVMAIPRAGADLLGAGWEVAKKIPGASKQFAKQTWNEQLNPLRHYGEDPLEAQKKAEERRRQSAAGFAEAGVGLGNLPHGIVDYLENRLNLLPNGSSERVPHPGDQTQKINNIFGAPQNEEDKFARGIAGNSLALIPGIKGASVVAGLPKKLGLPHLTQKGASKTLRQAEELTKSRNISPIKIDRALIKDAAQFLPKTSPYKNALKAAQKGNYNSLFDLQSELGSHAGDLAKSIFSKAERAHGREGMKVRNKLLEQIHSGLQKQGHNDISELLRKGQNEYRRYKKFKPYRNALALGAFGMLIPGTPITPIVKKVLSHSIQ